VHREEHVVGVWIRDNRWSSKRQLSSNQESGNATRKEEEENGEEV
jgi:hypothetical protein